MTTITSKIDGVQLWTYDIPRRPVKKLKNGKPQLLSYTNPNKQGDGLQPVTQHPTEDVNQAVNHFRIVFDVNHTSNGKPIATHGIQWKTSDSIDQQAKMNNHYSLMTFSNAMFVGDNVYIQAPPTTTVTNGETKTPFTTKTPGIKIIDQTGIIQSNRGFGVVIFEVEPGYKIPVKHTIKANIKVLHENENTGGIKAMDGSPETYPVITEIVAGVYEMTLTAGIDEWLSSDIDFATVQDPTTAPTTPTDPTTPTEPTTPPKTPTTIPIVQQLKHAKSNITGASFSRSLNAISLTADPGYTFQNSIQIMLYSGGKVVSDYNVPGNKQDTITIPLNTTKENTITTAMDNVQLTASATLETLHGGYEHNYLISDPELSAFSKEQIWNYSASGEGLYDVTQYINNLIELPFKVDTTTTVSPISVGRVNSNVVSHETKERFVTLDLGTIKVPAKYKNAYDYQNKSVKLFAPFVPPITINNENAIEKTIHISYKIDISSGDLTINLSNDNVLFYTGTNNIASQIPFLNTLKNTVINRDTHFNDSGIRQPYLVITRETPILDSAYYPTNERGFIKSYEGNVKVSVLNNMNIPNNELSALTIQLESGVKYVKSN